MGMKEDSDEIATKTRVLSLELLQVFLSFQLNLCFVMSLFDTEGLNFGISFSWNTNILWTFMLLLEPVLLALDIVDLMLKAKSCPLRHCMKALAPRIFD